MVQWEVPPTRRVAFVAVLLTVAASVVVTVRWDFRFGGYLLAAALGLAAALRALLPERYCLGLLVRSRRVDVLISTVLAVGVAVLARVVPVR